MKKILYSLLFAFIFFIGTNEINAGFQCYYKTDDGKIDMYVYFDGKKAYETLMKGYSKSDGFAEIKKDLEILTINLTSEFSSCPSTLKYTIVPGNWSNKYEFTNNPNIDTSGKNEYKLSNYNFDSTATTCNYTAVYGKASAKFTIKVNGDSAIFYWGPNNQNSDYRYVNPGVSSSANAYQTSFWVDDDPNFINTFISDLKENGKCPLLSHLPDNGPNFREISNYNKHGEQCNNDSSIIGEGINASAEKLNCEYFYSKDMEENKTGIDFYVKYKTYSNSKKEWCISFYAKGSEKLMDACSGMDEDMIKINPSSSHQHIFVLDESIVNRIKNYNEKCLDSSVIFVEKNGLGQNVISTLDGYMDGTYFKEQIESLQPYLEELANQKGISIPEDKMNLKINGENYSFPWLGNVDSSIDGENVESKVIHMLEETWKYCRDEIYTRKVEENEDVSLQLRKEECDSFRIMVEDAESLGLLKNITSECGMLSSDFTIILKEILNLIKIAGPILALGLGTVDFIKAMASGDADKEMKTAWKRFTTRLIAAILLFLIPIILAFILDRFLGNTPGNGYNPDNPFCIDTGMNE